jgi:5-methylthioadenosine/S-adenosylhomocysteine deaminase
MSPRRTLIRAGYVIAFDGRGHRLLRDGAVVLEGDRIVHVGPRFEGSADDTVDARDRLLTPGLMSTHAHVSGSPLDKSFIEDRGNPQFWFSGLFEMLPVRSASQDEEAGRPASSSPWASCSGAAAPP